MKTIILLLTIIMLNISCKKQKSVEPAPEPAKLEKSFNAKIIYHQDSIGSYYVTTTYCPAYITIFITNIPVASDGSTNVNSNLICYDMSGYHGPTGTIIKELYAKNTININSSFDYYINVHFTACTASGGVRNITYCKHYVFNEGDNGTINFNTLP